MKICTKCKVEKNEEEFAFKNISKGNRRTCCRTCHSEYRRLKYIENKEKEIQKVKEYRQLNPERYTSEARKSQSENRTRRDIINSIVPKHRSYSKKAGRTIESNCEICNKTVYRTNLEVQNNQKKYCSSECLRETFKDVYYHYCKDVLKRDKRGLESNVTPEYLKYLLEEIQRNKCNITGLPIRIFNKKESKTLYGSASLDRIDSSIGYVEGNVQWVCLGVNYMKMNFSNDELIETIRLIKMQE